VHRNGWSALGVCGGVGGFMVLIEWLVREGFWSSVVVASLIVLNGFCVFAFL